MAKGAEGWTGKSVAEIHCQELAVTVKSSFQHFCDPGKKASGIEMYFSGGKAANKSVLDLDRSHTCTVLQMPNS